MTVYYSWWFPPYMEQMGLYGESFQAFQQKSANPNLPVLSALRAGVFQRLPLCWWFGVCFLSECLLVFGGLSYGCFVIHSYDLFVHVILPLFHDSHPKIGWNDTKAAFTSLSWLYQEPFLLSTLDLWQQMDLKQPWNCGAPFIGPHVVRHFPP